MLKEILVVDAVKNFLILNKQRIANLSEHDFNPESIITESIRNVENMKVGE